MTIEYLIIDLGLDKQYKYVFSDKSLIFSHDNSKGKTTLIRFLLYSLGYQIPATEGIGDFERISFKVSIINNGKRIEIIRKGSEVSVSINGIKEQFVLPLQENELFSLVFGINNVIVLKNLLATFYIDQEKGWTLLNRGKIIGNIRFSIEEFVASLSGINIESLLDEKKILNVELKKYRYFKNVLDINSEFSDEENVPNYELAEMSDLLQDQKELELQLKRIKSNMKNIEDIISKNKSFADMIENYGLVIKHNGSEFVLTKEKLVDFDEGQELLKIKLNNYKIEEEQVKRKLDSVLRIINQKNTLFSIDDILSSMEQTIEGVGIDINKIDKIIRQLTNKRNDINKQIKEELSFNNEQLYRFYETIINYAKELEISDYISDKSPRYVLTNKLKGLSGRVLAQMSFVFKLSYIKGIKDKYKLNLPIIIDSPRTNELSESSTDDMLRILKRDFIDHQIIMASIYENSVMKFDVINLDEGLLNNRFLFDNKKSEVLD